MTISEYLIEAVARRGSDKYDVPEENWKDIVAWLEKKGFTSELSMKNFDSNTRCYIIGIINKKGIPYDLAVHSGRNIFDIIFDNDGTIERIELVDGSSERGWKTVDFEYFIKSIR